MSTLRTALAESSLNRVAIGHFNVSDIVALRACVSAAHQLGVPVLIGVSEGERDFIGVHQIAALVKSVRGDYGCSIFLNADHTHTLERAIEAAKAGFDSVIFDNSSLDFDTNVKRTKQAVEELKSINPEIIVEGEIGNIGTSSVIHDDVPDGVGVLTTAEEAKAFVDATGIDVLAPAVGNMHGLLRSMVAGETHKRLNVQRVHEIKMASGAFLTLHGASGSEDADLAGAIEAGVNIVHINTELRVAWRRGVETALREHPDEVTPYKLLPTAYEGIRDIALRRLRLFNRAPLQR